MSRPKLCRVRTLLLAGCAAIALSPAVAAAQSERPVAFSIPAQDLGVSLNQFARQSDHLIVFSTEAAAGRPAPALQGALPPEQALAMLLDGSGLTFRREGDAFLVVQEGEGGNPQGASGAAGAAEVEALVVTAQKREEAIQDVPIAISAFTQKDLEEQKIEGGFDLLKAIPNVTFSKNNFSGYNFSIRGVGTKAISATTDPGVAVAFNYTSLIQNRLFEQEYYDIERVEVLRGPQGTLYGRNATSGVINVISAKPRLNEFEASIKGEIGNYDTKRLVGMLNVPIVEDVLGIRIAGAATQRTGYDYNSVTGNNVNGRDLWSGRVTVGFEPMPRLRVNVLWEHFEEDDDRSRTGKQLCKPDPGKLVVGDVSTVDTGAFGEFTDLMRPALFSQGCLPVNLYDDEAFGTPNGLALPFVFAPLALRGFYNYGVVDRVPQTTVQLADPYGGLMQSRDLRTIASFRDPVYRAKADIFDLSIDFDVTDALTLTSQTVYNKDEVYSFQDYNRFNTFPVFTDSTIPTTLAGGPTGWENLTPGGVFCDPQLGCSDTIAGFDISQAVGEQFSQELRLQSDFDGPVNFSVGANYTEFETLIDYYVMYNIITLLAVGPLFYDQGPGGIVDVPTAIQICAKTGYSGARIDPPLPAGDPAALCPYIDPNPVESINGEGHNYFRSKNPYELKSWAGFGEVYWNITEALKLTAGLRYTKDEKTFIPVPSQVLNTPGFFFGGVVNKGYPEDPPIEQEWGEWTGRLGLDWKPELSFTDQTMLYAFYSRGYKGGGANPPTPDFATEEEVIADLIARGIPTGLLNLYINQGRFPILELKGVEYGPTFEPEFVDAYEVGAKNTLLDGAMTLNTTAFYYDYKDYQVSQIRDRTAVNENFDAKVWGLELETMFSPSRDFQLIWNLGYLDTEIADGESSIDLMNRTQGNPDVVLVKPWAQLPSNCVAPVPLVESYLLGDNGIGGYMDICGMGGFLGGGITDPTLGGRYDPRNYDGTNGTININGGAGIHAQLGGNELPNAPHWTTNVGAQYGRDVLDGSWRVTLRGDAYWQAQSWARVYNADPYDKLHGWYNVNVSVKLANEDLGLEAEFYVKNLLDKSPITDAFLNSDDSALTTNVFVLDPRLVGFYVRKTF